MYAGIVSNKNQRQKQRRHRFLAIRSAIRHDILDFCVRVLVNYR